MTTERYDNKLDAALRRLLDGEAVTDIVDSYPVEEVELPALLKTASLLDTLEAVEMPPAESIAADRNDFLAQITELQRQPVSPNPIQRLKGWVSQQFSWSSTTSSQQQKEMRKMTPILLKAAFVFAVAFGSLGGTLATAAGSLPDSAIYPIKLAMEQARLTLENDPAAEADLQLAFAQIRVQEMVRQAAKGEVPTEALLNRLQNHLGEAYHLATQAEEQEMYDFLVQASEMTQAEEKNLETAQERVLDQKSEQTKDQDRLQTQKHIQLRLKAASQLLNQWRLEAEKGLQEPIAFRLRHGQNRSKDMVLPTIVDPETGAGQEQKRLGQPDEPPGYGPGEPGGNPDCQGDCEPAGDQHQYGPGYGPGEPGGNPDCLGDCEPVGDQHQNRYGQESGEPPGGPANGPGEPGGNPDCLNDCEPVGDQHQNRHGQESEEPPGGPSNGPGEPGGNSDCQVDCDNEPNDGQHQEQNQENNNEQNGEGQNGAGSGGQQGDNSSGSGDTGGNADSGSGSSGGSDSRGSSDTGGSGSGSSGESGGSDSGGSGGSDSGGSGDTGGSGSSGGGQGK